MPRARVTSGVTGCGLLFLCGFQGSPLAGPGLTAIPAWDGRFVPGSGSEVRIELTSPQGGPFQLTLSAPGWEIAYSGVLEAEAGYDVSLPVRPIPGEPVNVTLEMPGEPPIRQPLSYHQVASPLAAWVRVPGEPLPEAQGLYPVDIESLPQTGDGYGSVASMAIASHQLTRLSPPQLAALDHFLSNCNPLLLSDGNQHVRDVVGSHSGCGGRYVSASGAPPQGEPVSALPTTTALDTLLPASGQGHRRIVTLYFAGYAVILLATLMLMRRTPALLSVPLIASLALPSLAHLGQTAPRLVSWAETASGDPSARFVALLTVDGNSRQRRVLSVDGRHGLPASVEDSRVLLSIDGTQAGEHHLQIDTIPFSRERFRLAGTFRLTQPLLLLSSDTQPFVENSGEETAPASLLIWEGEIHQVPPLLPGERWAPTGLTLTPRNDPLTRLLRERSGGAALLLPYAIPVAGSQPIQQDTGDGWLLIRMEDRS